MKPKVSNAVRVLAMVFMVMVQVHGQQVERIEDPDPVTLPRFEVASVKPSPTDWKIARTEYPQGSFVQQNQTLGDTVALAFTVDRQRIAQAPEWIWAERFSIDARMSSTTRPMQDRLLMLRALLVDRFGLRYHIESSDLDGYVLTVARGDGRLGPRLRPSGANCSNRRLDQDKGDVGDDCEVLFGYGLVDAHGIPLAILRNVILGSVDRFVVVDPSLSGDFDIKFQFTPVRSGLPLQDQPGSAEQANVFSALREQLGLKLEPARVTVDRIVIDHIERPTEN